MNIEEELNQLIAAKTGNNEMGIFYLPFIDNGWEILLGNQSNSVSLGESLGEISVEGKTLEEAIQKMKIELSKYERDNKGRFHSMEEQPRNTGGNGVGC